MFGTINNVFNQWNDYLYVLRLVILSNTINYVLELILLLKFNICLL